MPFLPPNQQRQSTEGKETVIRYLLKITVPPNTPLVIGGSEKNQL